MLDPGPCITQVWDDLFGLETNNVSCERENRQAEEVISVVSIIIGYPWFLVIRITGLRRLILRMMFARCLRSLTVIWKFMATVIPSRSSS